MVLEKYNYLTTIKRLDSRNYNGKKRKFARYLCDCGNIIERPESLVKNGKIKSCGCIRYKIKTEMVGKKFGSWTVIEDLPKENKQRMELCECDCGIIRKVRFTNLIMGESLSCGCKEKHYKIKYPKDIPNRERLLNIYRGMKSRCYNPQNDSYKYYGQRGISICKEWLDEKEGFENFSKWANSNNYSPIMSIDRINVNGNYEPDNCRWVELSEQSRNRRNCTYLTYEGKTLTLNEWAREIGCSRNTIQYRLTHGWNIEDILTKTISPRKK